MDTRPLQRAAVAQALAEARRARGMSQEQVADGMRSRGFEKITRAWVTSKETGRAGLYFEEGVALCAVLGIGYTQLCEAARGYHPSELRKGATVPVDVINRLHPRSLRKSYRVRPEPQKAAG